MTSTYYRRLALILGALTAVGPLARTGDTRAGALRYARRVAYHGLLVLVASLALFPIFWLLSGSLQ